MGAGITKAGNLFLSFPRVGNLLPPSFPPSLLLVFLLLLFLYLLTLTLTLREGEAEWVLERKSFGKVRKERFHLLSCQYLILGGVTVLRTLRS